MEKYTLLTGSTGLLGRYLLRDLLLAGKRIAVVVRTSQRQTVQQRIEEILQSWEKDLPSLLSRPIYLSGNITEDFLGLDEKSRRWVTEYCDTVIHSAASLTFLEEPDGEPWKTNVGGTRNVLQLCRETNIRKLHYVSTAYVCGMREDRVYESELDQGQAFRNDYEKSKLQAEQLIRSDDFIDELTVYRPAVIAGDSQSGYTNTYHGLYLYLKIMCILARNTQPGSDGVRRTEVQLHLTGDEQRNVIPVDWAAAVISHLFCTPDAHGHTFHLAPQVRMTPRQMIEAGCSYFNSTGVEFIGHTEELDLSDGDLQRHAYENSSLYRDYEYSDPEFDMTNLEKFAGHLLCPAIDEAMFHRFMKYGEDDNWGKRRQRQPESWFAVDEFFAAAVAQETEDESEAIADMQLVGLDIIGPGGGQWTVTMNRESLIAATPGISDGCEMVFSLPSNVLAAIVRSGGNAIPRELQKSLKPCEPFVTKLDDFAVKFAKSLFAIAPELARAGQHHAKATLQTHSPA